MTTRTKVFESAASKSILRIDRSVNQLTPSISGLQRTFGQLGLFVGGAAVVGAVMGAISIFADFEQANANLASVMTGTTQQGLMALQEDAKRLGGITSKTAVDIVGLQEAFARLGFEGPQIINMTEATIAGSVAMRAELSDTAELVGAVVRTFDQFGSIKAPEIIDKLTLATQKSGLNFEKLQTSIPIVAGAANAAGIPFNTLVALMGKLSDAGIDASSSATALRNIFIDSSAKGLTHAQIFEKIAQSTDKLTASTDVFGKRTAVSASVLSNHLNGVAELTRVIGTATAGMENAGVAQRSAEKQLDTLRGSVTILSSAYDGFILGLEDGTGAFSSTIRQAVQAATGMIHLASGTAQSAEQFEKLNPAVQSAARWGIRLFNITKLLIGAFLLWKGFLIGSRAALIGYNLYLGISTALQNKNVFALRGSLFAQRAFVVTTWLMTAAQTALNFAMNLNPISLIIIGIVALVAIVTVVIAKYDQWGAALTLLLGPLGLIINAIVIFRKNWDSIVSAFKTGGILEGLKRIGIVMVDTILFPLQQMLELVGKFTGLEIADNLASKVEDVRARLELVDPQAAETASRIDREERIEKSTTNVVITDDTSDKFKVDSTGIGMPSLTPTFG